MPNRYFGILLCLLFVLLGKNLTGQINIEQIENQYGRGETTLKKKINISFFYDETEKNYQAKVSYRIDKLVLGKRKSKGLIQLPFNVFQDLKLRKARYFKLDSIGNKTLIENVKVKYADVKDYFIEDIFYADLKVKQFNCSVDLPKNYFVSYTYDLIFKDLKFLSSLYFQSSYEAVEEVEISIKKNVNIDFAVFDFNLEDIKKTEDDTYIRYSGKNLKRYSPSSYSVKGSYYLPHIIISVKSFETTEKTTEVLNSTDNLYNWYNSLIKELTPNQTYIDDLAKSILTTTTKDEEKIDKIFKWVQNNVQYVAFEDGIAGFKPSESHDVAKLKYGDCKGMANLLVSLLRSQGFDANHAWLGTRSNNYSYDIPSLIVDNHMICGLNFNNKTYYLDGTSKSAIWSKTPSHIEGKEVMLANNDTYVINTIEKSSPDENVLDIKGILDLKSLQPKITFSVELHGHFARDFISYTKHSALKDQKNIPFYFMYNYLDGIKVENISQPIIKEGKITFSISGYYLNYARDNESITVFPFVNILKYDHLSKKKPPIYIDYAQTINVKLELKNGGKIPKENYKNTPIGNDAFSANFYIDNQEGKHFINQTLYLNLLHTPLDKNEDWNNFSYRVKAFNTSPLSYE